MYLQYTVHDLLAICSTWKNRLPREAVMPHPWKCLRPGGMGPWETLSSARCPCHGRRAGTTWYLQFLPTQVTLWFCEIRSLRWNITQGIIWTWIARQRQEPSLLHLCSSIWQPLEKVPNYLLPSYLPMTFISCSIKEDNLQTAH